MKLNACWRKKAAEIEAAPCVIQDVVELTESEYAYFYQNLMENHPFLLRHRDAMFYEGGEDHALLVLGKHQPDGILVDASGTSWAYYSAFVPNARDVLQAHIQRLANYCVFEGTEYSEDGTWDISYKELSQRFGTAVTPENFYGKALAAELQKRDEVNELIMTEDAIQITYHMAYCQGCQQGGVEGAMSVLSLMGCNLDEDHDTEPDETGPVQTM